MDKSYLKRPILVRNFSARSVVELEETYDESKLSKLQTTFHEFFRHLLLYLDISDLTTARLVSFYFYKEANATISLIVRELMHMSHNFNYSPQEILEKCSLPDFCHLAWLHEHTRSRVFLVGGGNIVEGSESYRRVDEYHRTNKKWQRRASMMKSRGTFRTEAITWAGKLIAISGDGQESVGSIEEFDPMTNIWSELPSLDYRLQHVGVTCTDDSVYVTGGLSHSNGGCSDEIFRLDQKATKWVRDFRGKTLCQRFGHGAVFDKGGRMWLLGGLMAAPSPTIAIENQGNGENGESQASSASSSTSVLGEAMETENSSSSNHLDAAEEVTSQIYKTTACTEFYCPLAAKWIQGPNLQVPRVWAHAFNCSGGMYIIGGDANEFGQVSMQPTIETYDTTKGEWKLVTQFPRSRRVFSCNLIGHKIYVIGGRGTHYDTMNDYDCFNTITCAWEASDEEFEINFPRSSFVGGALCALSLAPTQWTELV